MTTAAGRKDQHSIGAGQHCTTVSLHAGPRTAKGIADAATGALPDSFITRIQGLAGLDKFKSKSSLPKVPPPPSCSIWGASSMHAALSVIGSLMLASHKVFDVSTSKYY